MKALSYVSSSFFCLLLARNITALQWSSTPKNGEILYTCVNYDVSFAWDYTLDPGDVIHNTEWNYEGRSQEMVAASIHGNFLPLPAFSHRVQHVPDAGLILQHVTKGDAGNYSVTVTGHDSSGASFTMHRTALLQVADNLVTTDHELHAGQQPVAEFNNATQDWHAVLTCGQFTYTGDPPVSVEWQTPEGQTLPSTLYSQGLFKLYLPNPVSEGSYSCRISASTQNFSCAHGHGQQASVAVDGILTRLMLMEASLFQKNAVINQLTTKVETLEADLQTHKDHTTPPAIAFSARLSSSPHLGSGSTLVLASVLLNQGNAYSSSTGRFTAPLNGTYYFSAMATAYHTSSYAAMYLSSTRSGSLFRSFAYYDGHYQTGSLHGVVHLQRGEQVWLVSAQSNSYFWSAPDTTFSGFLLFVD